MIRLSDLYDCLLRAIRNVVQGFSYVLAAMAQVRSLRLSGVSASAKSIAPATDPLQISNAYDPVVVYFDGGSSLCGGPGRQLAEDIAREPIVLANY